MAIAYYYCIFHNADGLDFHKVTLAANSHDEAIETAVTAGRELGAAVCRSFEVWTGGYCVHPSSPINVHPSNPAARVLLERRNRDQSQGTPRTTEGRFAICNN